MIVTQFSLYESLVHCGFGFCISAKCLLTAWRIRSHLIVPASKEHNQDSLVFRGQFVNIMDLINGRLQVVFSFFFFSFQ